MIKYKLIELFNSFFPYIKKIIYKYDTILISSYFLLLLIIYSYMKRIIYINHLLNLIKNDLKDEIFITF